MLTLLAGVGCVHAIMADWSNCDGDYMAHKAKIICCLDLYKKCLLTPGLGCHWFRPWHKLKEPCHDYSYHILYVVFMGKNC